MSADSSSGFTVTRRRGLRVEITRAAQTGVDDGLAGFVGRVVEPLADLGREARDRVCHAALVLALAVTSTCALRTMAGSPGITVNFAFQPAVASPVRYFSTSTS